jgi:hypothetical protein
VSLDACIDKEFEPGPEGIKQQVGIDAVEKTGELYLMYRWNAIDF